MTHEGSLGIGGIGLFQAFSTAFWRRKLRKTNEKVMTEKVMHLQVTIRSSSAQSSPSVLPSCDYNRQPTVKTINHKP
jgi:hypothetical protein